MIIVQSMAYYCSYQFESKITENLECGYRFFNFSEILNKIIVHLVLLQIKKNLLIRILRIWSQSVGAILNLIFVIEIYLNSFWPHRANYT